jgi:hypothetical protein
MSGWKEIVDLSKSAVIVCHKEGALSLNGGDVTASQAILQKND